MKKIQILFGILMAVGASSSGAQTCTYNQALNSAALYLPSTFEIDMTAAAAAPLGSVIDTVPVRVSRGSFAGGGCAGPVTIQYDSSRAASYYNSFSIGHPGITGRLHWSGGPMGMPSGYLPLTTTASISNNMFTWDTGIMTLELIKYSESISSGAFTIPTGPAILAFVGGWSTTAGARLVSESGGAVTFIVRNKPTCSVSTKDVYVPLGAVPIRAFTGVGSASPEKRFSISLDCAGGDAGLERKIHTTLTDHTNPANQADTLSLAPGSGASGIGIQVLNGSTVIKYGPDSSALDNINQWQAGSSGNGTFNIPLTARYVQTAPAITPGSANGLATFTMSYE